MSQVENVRTKLAEAERAASTGDLVTAEELLRDVASLQESELGPVHPELANTLNNLAIVAERRGRPDDAETLYRRAVAIASASCPPDDPIVAASRRNLEEFCRAQGLPIDPPRVAAPAVREGSSPAVVSRASRTPAALAIGLIVLVTAALLVARPWMSRRASEPLPGAAPTSRPAAEPVPPSSAAEPGATSAAKPAPTSPAAPARVERTTAPNADTVAAGPPSDRISLVTAELCRNFSTDGNWRCDPAGDSVPPGRIVLYTRARSPRSTVIVHRWYRGDALRQSVQLRIGANPTEGYRTYSRQTVDPGDWRVEVRNAEGDLLHEQRLAVR